MSNSLPRLAPDVNPAEVIATGATQIRDKFRPDQVHGIVLAYMAGIKVALAIGIAGTGIGLLISVCNRWKRLGMEEAKKALEVAA